MPVSYQMRRVIIFTHNFAAMRDFYCDMFGLKVVEEDDGWADMAAGDCHIAIHAAGKGVTVGPDYEGPHKVVFYAHDVAAARADLISRGADGRDHRVRRPAPVRRQRPRRKPLSDFQPPLALLVHPNPRRQLVRAYRQLITSDIRYERRALAETGC